MDERVLCQMCGASHLRKNTADYAYYRGELYCITHPGVKQWYEGALEILEEKLRLLGVEND
jgi:hypothetical protein